MEHPQSVADRDAGRDDEEPLGETAVPGVSGGIDGRPCDQHCHNGGLAGPGRELQREPEEVRVGGFIDCLQAFEKALAARASWRNFGKPDRDFGRLYLTEEGPEALLVRVSPMAEQSRCFGRNLPVQRVGQRPPALNLRAHLGNGGLKRKLVIQVVKVEEVRLRRRGASRDGGDELGPPAARHDETGGAALIIEIPVPRGRGIWRVQDRIREEICHFVQVSEIASYENSLVARETERRKGLRAKVDHASASPPLRRS